MKMTGRGKANGGAMEALKKHEDKPASKAHKGLKTGGVVKGQGGYKTGGVIKGQGGYKDGGCATMKKGGKTGKKMAVGGLSGMTPSRMTPIRPNPPPTGTITSRGRTYKDVPDIAQIGGPDKKSSNPFMNELIKGIKVTPTGVIGSVPRPRAMMKKGGSAKKYANGGATTATITGGGKTYRNVPESALAFGPDGKPSKAVVTPRRTPADFAQMRSNADAFRAKIGEKVRSMKDNFANMKRGMSKKYAEGGSVQDGGRPQKMAQGAKKPSSPVEISRLSGTFKKGGKVQKYGKGGLSVMESLDQTLPPEEQLKQMKMRKAMNKGYEDVAKRDTAANEALLDSLSSLPKSVKDMLKKAMRSEGAVTDTETTVSRTVVPAKKRGGKVRK
jgi:hypothetical protein